MNSRLYVSILLTILVLGRGFVWAVEPPAVVSEGEPDPSQEWLCVARVICANNDNHHPAQTGDDQNASKSIARSNAIAEAVDKIKGMGCSNWVIDNVDCGVVSFAADRQKSSVPSATAPKTAPLWEVKFKCTFSDGSTLERTEDAACFCAACSAAREVVCGAATVICEQQGCTIKCCCYTIMERPCCPCR